MTKIKIILIFIQSVFICKCGEAQTFHAFIFCNSNNSLLHNAEVANQALLGSFLPKLANDLNYKYKDHVFAGNDFNFENLDNLLNTFNIQPNDIVFFYISTHGFRSADDSPLPLLWIDKRVIDYKHRNYPASEINRRIVARFSNAASVITFIEACNELKGGNIIQPQQTTHLKALFAYSILRPLFTNHQNVVISAVQPGVTAIAGDDGGMFLNAFLDGVKTYNPVSPATWEGLKDIVVPIYNDANQKVRRRWRKPRVSQWFITAL